MTDDTTPEPFAPQPIDALEDHNEHGIWIVRANGEYAATLEDLAAKLGVPTARLRLNINPELTKRTERQHQRHNRRATDVDAWLNDF